MAVIPHLESIAAIADQSQTGELFSYALRDFLDGFYEKPDPEKLQKEPTLLKDSLQDAGYADAYLAATAEFLAQKFGFQIPFWTKSGNRFLHEPVFAFKTPEGRMFLLVESPTAFRARNIYISADALTRV